MLAKAHARLNFRLVFIRRVCRGLGRSRLPVPALRSRRCAASTSRWLSVLRCLRCSANAFCRASAFALGGVPVHSSRPWAPQHVSSSLLAGCITCRSNGHTTAGHVCSLRQRDRRRRVPLTLNVRQLVLSHSRHRRVSALRSPTSGARSHLGAPVGRARPRAGALAAIRVVLETSMARTHALEARTVAVLCPHRGFRSRSVAAPRNSCAVNPASPNLRVKRTPSSRLRLLAAAAYP